MTSIEWFNDQLQNENLLKTNFPITSGIILKEAIERHKAEIVKAYEAGQKSEANGFFINYGERYYDELYPDCQLKTDDEDIKDRAEAFHNIVVAMGKIKDHQDRLQVYLALQKYIKSV